MMLAYALSQSYVQEEMTNARTNFQPFPPPNSPHRVHHDVMLQVETETEEDENDGIDFRRVRAELDRLLDEDFRESDDDVVDEDQDEEDIISVMYHVYRPRPTMKIFGAGRMSRSL
ncbi:unnamed protein product [Hyaloperonospora brassicae]|uniref:RxLR effector candidate protein n=1 Tax=Hyaloperonospora brassicae TaxID=162125 RepID=A0AAV0TQ67_HYABA|nr:unnamed protein product [Hyaloperonospora brassicae]